MEDCINRIDGNLSGFVSRGVLEAFFDNGHLIFRMTDGELIDVGIAGATPITIRDDLTHDEPSSALSAAQGKALKDTTDTLSDTILSFGDVTVFSSTPTTYHKGITPFTVAAGASLSVGGVTVPAYSNGILVASGVNGDCILFAEDYNGHSYTAFSSGGSWINGRMLVTGQQSSAADVYTPSITATSTGFEVSNISFAYTVNGNVLRISGRFNITNTGTGGDGFIMLTLPSGYSAKNMGVGPCGYVVLNSPTAHNYSVRCDGGTTVYIQTGAGSGTIAGTYSGYVLVDFSVII